MDAVLEDRPSAAPAAAVRVIAVVQAAGARIGIDGEHVVQAVPMPAAMTAMPRRSGGIAGVMAHGGQLVPVVRLDEWLAGSDAAVPRDGDAPPQRADARVLILRDGQRVIGLLVDAVVGMTRCPANAVTRLFHDERPQELFARAALLDAAQPPLALLEPARLAALAHVWAAAAPETAAGVGPAAGGADESAAVAPLGRLGVFRIGDRLVGLCAQDIGELLPVPVLRAPPFRDAATRGLCDWRGRLLPVVDIGAELGALAQPQAPAWICVVRHGERLLGVLVHELVELLPHDGDGESMAGSALVRHELPTPGGIVQLLDTAALMAHCPASVISERREAAAAGRERQETSPHTWLVFDAAGDYAARIDGVQEIVPLPADLRPRLEAGAAVSFAWRGHAVPVRGLFAQAGAGPAAADARLLVIVVDGTRRVAVPIAGVRRMIGAGTATLARVRVGARVADVVSTAASSPERASYEVVDLLARAD